MFTLAESVGGVESLIEHPALVTHATIPAAQRAGLGIGYSLIGPSVGVEDVEGQRQDLRAALAAIWVAATRMKGRMMRYALSRPT